MTAPFQHSKPAQAASNGDLADDSPNPKKRNARNLRREFWLALAAIAFFGGLATAQLPSSHRLQVRSNPTDVIVAERLAEPPPLPPVQSPVDVFRELLDMTPEEQTEFLTDRPPDVRKRIMAKVREYESLNPVQRELRLRVTELRWYLWPLLKTPATNRAAWLSRIPPDERKLVEDRLRHWDKLTPEVQKELLANDATLRYFSELAASTDQERSNIVKNLSPERRKKLEAGIQQLQQMPEQQRQMMITRFDQFFELSPSEKSKALKSLSEPERRQIEKTLTAFGQLSPELRDQCIRSFEKFINMSLAERQQFLKNAERWKLMSPDERQDWCDLVASMAIQPPLPPGWEPPVPGSR
jgi:hypothetical protein